MIQNQIVEVRNPAHARVPQADGLKTVTFPQLPRGGPLRLGFLNNRKSNTDELLAGVAAGLGSHYDVAARTRYKRDAAHPAPDEVIQELHRDADLVVVATGD